MKKDEEEKASEEASLDKVKTESLIPASILAKLREEFPVDTHYSTKMDNEFVQTGIRPAYVTERLNQVFGFEGWEAVEVEIKEDGKDIATKVRLTVFLTVKSEDGAYTKIPIAVREQWGSTRRFGSQLYGDALKSAFTNGLCKAASLLDVAHHAYKGLLAPVESIDDIIDENEAEAHEKKKKSAAKKSSPKSEKTSSLKEGSDKAAPATLKSSRKELLSLFTSKGLTRVALQKMMQKEFGKDESRQLDENELTKLIELVKEFPDESHTEASEKHTEEVTA